MSSRICSYALCVPDSASDPAGYQAATASCDFVTELTDCDGPEDCAKGEYCVFGLHNLAASFCSPDPAPEPEACCFTCDTVVPCTLCWTSADCAAGNLCAPTAGSPQAIGGCQTAN
jgi:hypothetical protein